ncbi:hypothetical protein J2S05_002901 [Alkalicoccobacillus murimartini]|uniref:Uncharacterized protein n=1 Tax=Alkalicoccobacillus murimartini TaxID=171685 RepID=A0ABT9YLM4_9BACI|nr:hypothetical protein [Alkalicoccobacillus murimartini]
MPGLVGANLLFVVDRSLIEYKDKLLNGHKAIVNVL